MKRVIRSSYEIDGAIAEEYGLTEADLDVNSMNEILNIAHRMGVEYRVFKDMKCALVTIADKAGEDFERIIKDNPVVYWSRHDFNKNFSKLMMHFTR